MFVSYKWLGEYLDLSKVPIKELADQLSLTGLEVEGIRFPSEGLKKIIVGEVKECVPHNNSDHLFICQVDIGEEELTQIVCGAPNIKAGIKVIVALPGARIANNIKIKKGKVRGEVSNGMICSLQEIGYMESVVPKEFADGIYYLPFEAVNGEAVFPYLEMDDAIIELAITPNRADALSIRGVAYEVGAIYRQTPSFEEPKLQEDSTETVDQYLTVEVADQHDTLAYQIRIIKDVKIAESPLWLQTHLMNEGIRPINNVVDVTNYILLLFGQPLHAFDYHKLQSKKIVVQRGKEKEEFVTLDGELRELSSENIVVTNGNVPVALAGIMGGKNSEVTSETTTIALEAALFDSVMIRQTSKMFNLRSESSSRFEKGINQATINLACDTAAALIAELAGGTVIAGREIGTEVNAQAVTIPISLKRINDYLGTELTETTVSEIFDTLGFSYIIKNNNYQVTVPPRRWDIAIEADLIEEVARIYGYDRLPTTLPKGETLLGSLTPNQALIRQFKAILEGQGLSEVISYALTTEEKSKQFMMKSSLPTSLQWPMSQDRSHLRMNLISGLLDDIAYNVARKNNSIEFYEVGRVFYQNEDSLKNLPYEENHLAMALTGNREEKDWQTQAVSVDFYTLKGIIETLFEAAGIHVVYQATKDIPELHPGRTAFIYLEDQMIGFIGQVHPALEKQYNIPTTYVAELNLFAMMQMRNQTKMMAPISKFPAVNRDIALLVDKTITNQEIINVIKQYAGKYLANIEIFDVYQGSRIEADKKSMAYSLTFINDEATLTDEVINHSMEKIEKGLIENLAVVIR
ncbi:phenylalanine--tRNA ligase subunit beta [Melissococcus plutonius]|uniref:phenylalanine--tRNA ligase subunit beta n=1 Tax=Melissococcus plutonius TaxID=33970 RepID=UPI003C2D98A3